MAFNKSSAASFFPRPFPIRGERGFFGLDYCFDRKRKYCQNRRVCSCFLGSDYILHYNHPILSHISESNGSPTVKYAISVLLSALITLSDQVGLL
jgi:hypothetical protein